MPRTRGLEDVISARGRRAVRLLRRRTPRRIGGALAREGRYRRTLAASEASVRDAGREGSPVVIGPCLAEVGFELLYWIPLARRTLERYGIRGEQVTAVSRGGVASWYSDIAHTYVDVLDIYKPTELRSALISRRAETGDLKQLTIASLDREILDDVGRAEGTAVMHPSYMFLAMRHFFAGERSQSRALRAFAHRPLDGDAIGRPPPELPLDYVAVKAYFSDCFPDTRRNRSQVHDLVTRLAGQGEVVVLANDSAVDAGHDGLVPDVAGVHVLAGLGARDNLGIQTAVVAGARKLFSTYGGFAYLGVLAAVDTCAFHSNDSFNSVHLSSIQAVRSLVDVASFELCDVRSGPIDA